MLRSVQHTHSVRTTSAGRWQLNANSTERAPAAQIFSEWMIHARRARHERRMHLSTHSTHTAQYITHARSHYGGWSRWSHVECVCTPFRATRPIDRCCCCCRCCCLDLRVHVQLCANHILIATDRTVAIAIKSSARRDCRCRSALM